jgi:predicted nucleotidyltransferase
MGKRVHGFGAFVQKAIIIAAMTDYLPRDFIETAEGLIFAVVDGLPEDGKVLCFLRYATSGKLSTDAANALLRERHPHYLHHSARLDARLHAVPIANIGRHHRPRGKLLEILKQGAKDAIEAKLLRLLALLAESGLPLAAVGVTGSLLIGRQTPVSDLDLVVYGREPFRLALARVRQLVDSGHLHELDEAAWREAYERRGCELSYAEFVWHERRKGNMGMVDGTKFDLALIVEDAVPEPAAVWRKTGKAVIRGRVLDASRAYDQPARYAIDHPDISEILCFTHTYTGQAKTFETIEAAGAVEVAEDGRRKRLIVGSSREAVGEFVRVLARLEE